MKLADYYRTNGESEHVAAVENALSDEWQSTAEIAEAAGKSRNYTHSVLKYLHEEGRAASRKADLERPVCGQAWRYEWKTDDRGGQA